MAVKDCDELSNIISLGIISWDDELAEAIASLSARKRDALTRAWKLKDWEDIDSLTWFTAHELELKANSADIEMRAIVQAKILNDEVRVWDAYRELAQQIKQTGWTMAGWVELLEKLRNASPADYENIAKMWWWKYANNPMEAIKEMKKAMSETISANYSIRQYSDFVNKWLAVAKKELRDWTITQEEFEKRIKSLHKEALSDIKKWENPKNFAKLDTEWATIKKIFWDDPLKAGKTWSQFIMARELLADWWIDDGVLKAFQDMWAEALTWELTYDELAKYGKGDLDKLLARAYTNTEQLYKDWALREAYREKLIELTSWMRISQEDIKKARSIMNTMEFAEKWATFSDVVTADNAARSARKRGLNVKDWNSFIHWIQRFAEKMNEDPSILKDTINVGWIEMRPIDLIQVIYDITWDENILKLLRIWFFNDGTILSVATTSLLWWNKEAAEKILKLFSKAKEAAKVTSIRDVSLKAITWDEIKEWAPMAFFDFRKSLYRKDELNRTKADFMDKLAEKNKMKVNSENIDIINPDIDNVEVLAEELKKYKWWYIIVNDSQYKTNSVLSDALDKVNADLKDEEKITALFPRWGMSSNFSVENWQIFFKTLDDDMYKNVAWTISIQTLWEARPTREILATAVEAWTWKNADKVRYQPSYTKWAVDNQWRQMSDQQYEYWFIKDENDNAITFYHWTWADFDEFSLDKFRTWSWDSQLYGFYFTTEKDWKVLLKPEKATRQIEVYIQAKNPVRANTSITDVMSEDKFRLMVQRYFESIWKKYDPRRDYKIEEWFTPHWIRNQPSTIAHVLSNVWAYDWIFGDSPKEFMRFFKEYTWIDWIWDWDKIFVAFTPEQIKYVDNRVPTANPNMKYMRYLNDTWVTDADSLRHFRDREDITDAEVADMIYDYIYEWLDRSRVWWVVEFWSKKVNWKKFDALSTDEQRAIVNRIQAFENWYELMDSYKKMWWTWWVEAFDKYDWNWLISTNAKFLSHLRKNKKFWYTVAKILEWDLDLNKFLRHTTYYWFAPMEMWIYVDDAWKVLNVNVWISNTNWQLEKTDIDAMSRWATTFYHNHPNWSFFSKGDIKSMKTNLKKKVKNIWLILPWWVQLEFPLTDEFLALLEKYRWTFDTPAQLEWAIYEAYKISDELGIINKQNWWAFSDTIEKNTSKELSNKFKEDIAFDVESWIEDSMNDFKRALTPQWYDDIVRQRKLASYTSQADLTPTDAMKLEMFTKDRTWKQIADAYWIPVEIVQWNMINWVAAYWAYWNWLIYFSEMVKESTAPHELFHYVFDLVDESTHAKILADANKLFWYDADKAEEILADAFAEWFKTWKLTYWELWKKWQKTFFKKVEQFFKDIAEWLWLVDNHRAEVEQLFNDMVNLKYLPDAGKNINDTEAMIKYNDELDRAAVNYFWQMLWFSDKEINEEYINRVHNMLSERLNIDLKAFTEIKDKSALWQRINQQFAIDRLTAWKYDKEIVDLNSVKNAIAWLTDKELEVAIRNDLWDVILRWNIQWNESIDHIREAYLDYKTATSAIDSLTAKWKIVSLANGWTAETMSMQQIKDMFKNWTFADVYGKMFLSNQELTPEEMKMFISKINNNIFDTLSITFAENLVSAWYALPLMNIKSFVYDYLRGNLDLNNKFVEAFLYKNNIPFSQDWLKTLVDTLMPAEFKFNYEDSLFKWRFNQLENVWNVSVFRESNNRFLQDSYSALAAVEMAKDWNMPVNLEEDILNWILDKYVNEVYNWVKDWTLTFQKAEELKQEAWYALDMFEQDFLVPRYWRFLSKQERQWLMWMKYQLPIWVAWQNPDRVREELISVRNKIAQKYKTTLWSAAENNDINMSIIKWVKWETDRMQAKIDARRQMLAENGWVIREVNGQYLVYDAKQALEQTIEELPETISWLGGLKNLWRAWIEQMSNKQAYALLRYLEAAKWLESTANYATELLYKQNPKLAQYNFFERYRVKNWLPQILEWNLLNVDKYLSKFDNTAWLDDVAKRNIFGWIISKFKQQWYVTLDDLDKIISKWIAEAHSTFKEIQLTPKQVREADNRMKLVYKKAFMPYTYLRDIPKWGTLLDWTPVRNIKKKVDDTMKLKYTQAIDDLKAVWMDDVEWINSSIYITTDSGKKVSIQEAATMNSDSWKKDIFDDESVFVAWADTIKTWEWTPDNKKLIAQEKEWRTSIVNQYDSTLQAMLNQTQVITKAEADLMTSFMNDVRTTMRKYTLTNQVVDALDALSWLNEEAARWIKDYLIGWKWNISFWKWKPWQIKERLWLVQWAYQNYYVMDLTKLNSVVPTSRAEDLALRLAKYFKNLERLLGSADWLTWCTTNADLNKAFYRIWEVMMNIDTVKWVFWLLSAVEQNQILKLFKFAKWDLAQKASVFIRRGKWNFQESLWWYRDYAEDIVGIDRDTFNEIFASNFSEEDFKRILQWLTGFSLTWAWWRTWMKILNVLNWSNFIMRALMSYPGQLLTIPQQSVAYFLKQIWFEKELWVESLSEVDAVRMHYWVLDWAYNEIVLRWKSNVSPDDLRLDSYYNRYWLPDVTDIYKNSPIESSDDYINMYAKIDNQAASSISSTNKWFRQLDPYKDNANNIIDWLFARNFKNISFLKAIKHNDFMQFASAKEFMAFMDDPKVSAEIKTRLMDRVSAYSGRNFRNILWLGFWWIDRAVGWSWFWNIMYWLMQMFNFRWSWWQNIFKQTWANLFTALKMLSTWMWSREWRENIARYIASQPEFTNFVWSLFNDLRWTWKLQRFQDNWRWPEDDDMYDALDFIDYMTETLNLTSQWYQWLQSFWPFRPIDEAWRSIFASHMDPTIYKDTFWVWAFFNALGKNFWRQWKPYNWIAKWAWAWTTDWPEWAMAYLENEWWKLSFGSLRYMINEDNNSYGYTYEMTWQTWGIPSIIMWEAKLGSDKNFSYEIDNTETWETIKQIFSSDIPWDTRWTYAWNLGKTFVNWSQLASLYKNVNKAIQRSAPSYFTADDLAETIQKTNAWLEFYQKWYVTPKTPEEAEIFFNTMLENAKYRPGSSNFTKSIIQYEDYWHMDWKNWKEADAEMELWLSHMKYLTNEHWEFEISWNEKVVDPSWNKLIEDIRTHWNNETYTTNLIYNYSKNWLNNHSSDPNYQLYVKMLWQWQAHNLIEYRINQVLEAANVWKEGKDNKWTKTELENVWLDKAIYLQMWQTPLEWDDKSFFDKLQVLDEDDATVAALQIIQSQAKEWDRKVLDRFFNVKENDDWSKSISLRWQYESTLKQIGAVAKAIDDWNVELAVAEASTLVNMYTNNDPTWAITATLIDSVYNRIYDTNSFSPEQKQAAMIALFHKNKDFIQRNPDQLRKFMWDDYDVYADYMNQMLYQWDWMTISNLESMQSSWKSSSWASKAASSFSSALKSLASKIGWSWKSSWWTMSSANNKQWVPVVIKGSNLIKELWVKGYTPTVNKISISAYKPHADFSIWKDINRSVKAVKTQDISNKKQLSKLEQKVTKAIEAES